MTRKEVSEPTVSAPPRRGGGEPSRSVHRDHRRRLRGGASVAGERAARHFRVGGQMSCGRYDDGRRRDGRLSGRLVESDAARSTAEPPAENVLGASGLHAAADGGRRLDGTGGHGGRDGRVPDVVVEAAAPLPPAEYAAELAVHAPVPVREQYGRDDGVRGQRQESGQRSRGRDPAAGQRRPLGQLEHRVRRPARGRRDND